METTSALLAWQALGHAVKFTMIWGTMSTLSHDRLIFAMEILISVKTVFILPRGPGAVSIRKKVLPGMAIPMLKIRRPNGRLIFNMEIAIHR